MNGPFDTSSTIIVFIVNVIFGNVISIDGIVGQMDVLVVQVVLVNRERFCCKTHKTIVVEVELDRVDTGQENVESQVELEPVDEEGVGDVLLHDEVLLRHLHTGSRRIVPLDDHETGVQNIFGFRHKSDSFAARVRRRFHDPNALGSDIYGHYEVISVVLSDVYLLLLHFPFEYPLVLRKVVGLR